MNPQPLTSEMLERCVCPTCRADMEAHGHFCDSCNDVVAEPIEIYTEQARNEIRSAVEGLRNDHYEVSVHGNADFSCTKCSRMTAIRVSTGERKGWCRACNEAHWFPAFAEENTVEELHDANCEGSMCYCKSRRKKEGAE